MSQVNSAVSRAAAPMLAERRRARHLSLGYFAYLTLSIVWTANGVGPARWVAGSHLPGASTLAPWIGLAVLHVPVALAWLAWRRRTLDRE